VPTFLGFQGGVTFQKTHTIYLGLGRTPPGYTSMFGAGAALLGDNSAYQDLAEAALQENATLKFGYRYAIDSSWSAYFHYQGIRASGEGEISKVLEASTGVEYPNMTYALINAGQDPFVDIEDELHSIEAGVGYNLAIDTNISVQLNAGILRVYFVDVGMATGLSNFDNSLVGQATLQQAEEDTEQIILD
jgi:hypothetical protein